MLPRGHQGPGLLPLSTSNSQESTWPLATCHMRPYKGASFPDQALLLSGPWEEAARSGGPGLIPPVPRIHAMTLGKSFRESSDLYVLVSDGHLRPENSEGWA